MSSGGQFQLLRQRRFLPFFGAQALGAFNDNLYKNILVVVATMGTTLLSVSPETRAELTNLAGGIFILPYVLFSGLAGQLADRFDKALVMKIVKACEIGIMALAAMAFFVQSLPLLLIVLFLMGMHSTFFGPAKYSMLPEVLNERELVGGNALVEMGTFLAILLGTLVAGVLANRGQLGWINLSLCLVALTGFLFSLGIPKLPAANPQLRIDWNPWTSTLDNLRVATESRTVFLSILGNSWFWFYGALVLAQLPLLVKEVIGGQGEVLTVTLVVFSAGIGLGSLLCERLSGRHVEIGLVPFGSLGLTIFAVDLYFALPTTPGDSLTVAEFLAQDGSWRVLADLLVLGIFGGFFIVPLYALIQQRSRREVVSRVMGANNIINAIFMVAAAGFGLAAAKLGMSIPTLILVTAILNAAVSVYIYTLVPEFLLRFIAWILVRFVYRLEQSGIDHIPAEGPALLVCNHVSFADAIVISAACPRPIRFIMESSIFKTPVLGTIFRGMKCIPVAPAKENPAVYENAFKQVAAELAAGNLVCIFPEGRLTATGELGDFRPGMMRILRDTPVPVIPLALSGLWGSLFSRYDKSVWKRRPRRLWSRIGLRAGPAVLPDQANPEDLRNRVMALRLAP